MQSTNNATGHHSQQPHPVAAVNQAHSNSSQNLAQSGSEQALKTGRAPVTLLNKNEEIVKARLKIREFDWFQIETKLRQLVMELIEPTVQRMSSERQRVDEFQESLDAMLIKLSAIDSAFLDNEKRMVHFDSATERIKLISQEVSHLGSSRVELHATIASLKESMAEQITLQKNLRKEVNLQNETSSTKIEFSLQRVEKMREDVAYNLELHGKRMKAFQDEIREEFSQERERRVIIERDISNMLGRLDHKDKLERESQQLYERLDSRTVTTLIDVDHLKSKVSEIKVMASKFDTIRLDANRMKNALAGLHEYVDLYMPLNTHAMISETLSHCLPRERFKAIAEFDEKAFAQINTRIANQKVRETFEDNIVTPEAFDFKELNAIVAEKITEIMKRNLSMRRSSGKLKERSEKKKMKAIANVSEDAGTGADGNDNQNVVAGDAQQVVNGSGGGGGEDNNEQQTHDVGAGTAVTDAKKEELKGESNVAPTGEVAAASGAIYYSDRPDKDEMEVILQELNQMIHAKVDPLKESHHTFVSRMEKRMVDFEEESSIAHDKICEFNEMEQAKLLGLKSSLIKQVEEQDMKLEHSQKGIQLLSEATLAQEQNINMLNQFAMVVYKLMLQDEKDKQAIGLYGFQETDSEKTNNGMSQTGGAALNDNQQRGTSSATGGTSAVNKSSLNIRVDENCLSCSGKSTVTNQFFKLACLAYKPYPIEVDGKDYSRLELLQVCSNMMTQLKVMLSSTPPQQQQSQSYNNQRDLARKSLPSIDYTFKNYQVPLLNEIVAQTYRSTSRQSRATRTPAALSPQKDNQMSFSYRSNSNPGSRLLIHEKPGSAIDQQQQQLMQSMMNSSGMNVQPSSNTTGTAVPTNTAVLGWKETYPVDYTLPAISQPPSTGINPTAQPLHALFFKPTTRKLVSKKPPQKQANQNLAGSSFTSQPQQPANPSQYTVLHQHSNPDKFRKFVVKQQQHQQQSSQVYN